MLIGRRSMDWAGTVFTFEVLRVVDRDEHSSSLKAVEKYHVL